MAALGRVLPLVIALTLLVVVTIVYNANDSTKILPHTQATNKTKTFTPPTPSFPQTQELNQAPKRVDLKHVNASFQFLKSRQKAYEDAHLSQNWHLRGIAHLYVHKHVLLVGQLLILDPQQPRHRSIRIDNVYSARHTEHKEPPPRCDMLSLWVRVRGPEIFAGKAQPIQESSRHCYWQFDFETRVPGYFKIEAKVLLWNAFHRRETESCVAQRGSVPQEIQEQYPQHAGFKGFKLYGADVACCTICTRQIYPPCRYWATPAAKLGEKASLFQNGCELFFDANVTELPFASFHLGDARGVKWPGQRRFLKGDDSLYSHGYPLSRDNPPAYFLGCGWSQMFTLDFPCISAVLDDQVYLVQDNFTIPETEVRSPASEQLPLCTLQDEYKSVPGLPGRWVKEPWPNHTVCPHPFFQPPQGAGRSSRITQNDGEHPHCWHRDNLAGQGLVCMEMNCRFIHDWSRYKTDFREMHWMGVWRRYDCDYYEYTDAQLQQCVDQLGIKRFNRDGKSIATMVGEYLTDRIKPLNFSSGGKRTVTLGTLGVLHQCRQTDKEFNGWLLSQRNYSNEETDFYFLISPYFITSEREVNAHLERMALFDGWFKSKLGIAQDEANLNKGYRYLNAFDMSAAMSYEVSGQLDGMHIIGPTAKMIVTKLFHHLCHNVVDGSRV